MITHDNFFFKYVMAGKLKASQVNASFKLFKFASIYNSLKNNGHNPGVRENIFECIATIFFSD